MCQKRRKRSSFNQQFQQTLMHSCMSSRIKRWQKQCHAIQAVALIVSIHVVSGIARWESNSCFNPVEATKQRIMSSRNRCQTNSPMQYHLTVGQVGCYLA
ncbi:hypothetical protein MPSEU_000940100 [Mayamaea pseudoterrestris]|nr:hypothetical protein MPSEU_000940100 [Mayamaea pseudoterrestris]